MKLFILSAGVVLVAMTLLLWYATRHGLSGDAAVQLQPAVQRRSVDATAAPAKPPDRPPPSFAAVEPTPRPPAPDAPAPSLDDQRVHLQAHFETETVDSGWASAARQELNEDLGRVANRDVRLLGVECHSSLCRVELSLARPGSGDTFMESWLHQRTWRGPGLWARVGAESDMRMVMFLGRPNSDLPYLD